MVEKSNEISAQRIDELVATYAPVGARLRRAARLRRLAIASGLVTLIGAAGFLPANVLSSLGQSDVPRLATTGPAAGQPDRLARDRAAFADALARLEREIDGINAQKRKLDAQQTSLAEQQATLSKQSELLAQFLDNVDTGQSSLALRQDQGARLDQEIAAIAAQRAALEDRWTRFEAQGELLAMEIGAVQAQRKELDLQSRQISRQREELSQLLDLADRFYQDSINAMNGEPLHEDPVQEDAEPAEPELVAWNAVGTSVDGSELGAMRGGFSIGEELDVSFGYTQTGSINGVEQYTNSFTIGSMSSGFQDTDMSNMSSVVLQNGDGNFVSGSVLDSLADSFGSVIQNTLDDQLISTTTTYDIELHNVPGTMQGIAGEQALMDSVSAFR